MQATDPPEVMYGWCTKCRDKYAAEYAGLQGNNCTYCGGSIEDNYPPAGCLYLTYSLLMSSRFPAHSFCHLTCCHKEVG